jgi:xanthine dehydrogenase small subunit
VPIIEAGVAAEHERHARLDARYPPAPMLAEFDRRRLQTIELSDPSSDAVHVCRSAASLNDALEFLNQHPDAAIVAGATDIGVRINKSTTIPPKLLDLNRVTELDSVAVEDGELVLGTRASWTALEEVCEGLIPEFHKIITVFGAPQIRHVGTIGGNIANASPIADSLPFLYVMEAALELRSVRGSRNVNINDFYKGYKKLDLLPGELIARVRVPLPADDELLRLYKVSRRRDLDIASFTAAIRIRLDGDTIAESALAFGAVGPTVIRARQTEEFLRGRTLDENTMLRAGDVAVAEISPISDVRGAADYRYQLTRNILLKFYHETQSLAVPA